MMILLDVMMSFSQVAVSVHVLSMWYVNGEHYCCVVGSCVGWLSCDTVHHSTALHTVVEEEIVVRGILLRHGLKTHTGQL